MSKTFRELLHAMGGCFTKADLYSAKAMGAFSAKILKKRVAMGMNQTEFARFMGVSQGMISKWESAHCNFTFCTAAEICEKLGMVFEVKMEDESAFHASRYPAACNDWIENTAGASLPDTLEAA